MNYITARRAAKEVRGKAEAVDLSEEFRETAVRAAQIMGLRVAGVDMLEGKDGPQVMEVNSSPGLTKNCISICSNSRILKTN